jgi:hypothetical protein
MKLYCQDSSHFQSFQSESQGAVHQEDSCFPNFDRKSFKIDKLNMNGFTVWIDQVSSNKDIPFVLNRGIYTTIPSI